MFVISPISGRANEASHAIWPRPRIPISTMQTSVSGSIRPRVSGTPSSLLKFPSDATVRRCRAQSVARMSLVVVLPAAPVMPTIRAVVRSRTAPPTAASATCASSGTSAAAAPRARACATKSSPSPTATNRSPSSTRRESICRPVTSLAQGRATSRPSGSIRSSSSGITGAPSFLRAPCGPPPGRRTAPCRWRAPARARLPGPRSPLSPPARPPRAPG